MINTYKIGFNLFSKSIFVVRIIYAIVLLIYSVNYRIIYNKIGKDFGMVWLLIVITVLFTGIYIGGYGLIGGSVLNFSETYDKCCISGISSNKVYI